MTPKRKHSFKGYEEPYEDDEAMFREFDIYRFLEDAATYKDDPRIPLGTPACMLPRRVGTEKIRAEEYIALGRLLAAFPRFVTWEAARMVPRNQVINVATPEELPSEPTQKAVRCYVGFLCSAVAKEEGWAKRIWPVNGEEPQGKSQWKEADSVIRDVAVVLREFWKGNEEERLEALITLREMVQRVFGFMPDMRERGGQRASGYGE